MAQGPEAGIRLLDFEEADRLLAAAAPKWFPMIALALKTGLRMGELLALEWGDVDLDPRDSQRIYAGTHEFGVWFSDDGAQLALNLIAARCIPLHLSMPLMARAGHSAN